MTPSRLLVLVLLAVLAAPAAAHAQDAQAPAEKALYEDGPSGRHLLDGGWLFRTDPASDGDRQGFQRQTTAEGWSPTTAPNAWNATDESVESFIGGLGWYRKDFRLPSAAARLDWIVRFESVNYRSRVWLNGRPIGSHKGAYLPFELRLPAGALKRTGTNRLVVRVDNRRLATDFPPSGLSDRGTPTGGWWNYGGLLREVYLRKVDTVDFSTVQVRPELPCATCAATVAVRTTLRNHSGRPARVRLTGRFGDRRLDLGTKTVGAGRFVTFARDAAHRPAAPVGAGLPEPLRRRPAGPCRRPAGPALLPALGDPLREGVGRQAPAQRARAGLPRRRAARGRRQRGFAIDNGIRRRVAAEAQELGATMLRRTTPCTPTRTSSPTASGLMVWSEIPVYALKTRQLSKAVVRRMAARELERTSSPTRTTRPSSPGRWATSSAPAPVPCRACTCGTPPRRPSGWTRRAPCRTPSRATRPRAARRSTGRSTCSGSTSTSAGTPARAAPSPTAPR
jgi:beta-glucuronidase